MAELIAIAAAYQPVYSLAWTVLTKAYSTYEGLQTRREQLQCLLDRCRDLLTELGRVLRGTRVPDMSNNLNEIVRIIEKTGEIVMMIQRKGFVWCLLHGDDIDQSICNAGVSIADAFDRFNIVAHHNAREFQQQMEEARQLDHTNLAQQLEELARNDQKILGALEDKNGQYRRMEELLIGISKHVSDLSARHVTTEDNFLRAAVRALERLSAAKHGRNAKDMQSIESWTLTSLEVTIHEDRMIGRGSFGHVYRGEWYDHAVAVKQMYIEDSRSLDDSQRRAFLSEVNIWARLKHPNIVMFYGACVNAVQPFMVSQLCQFGNVCSYLVQFPNADRRSLLNGIVAGMMYLHNKNIVHGDLKGVNILVGDHHNTLITDFGISRLVDESLTTGRSRDTTMRHSVHGTSRWMAPECLYGDRATRASDVYSFSMTAWEIYSGEVPFTGVAEHAMVRRVDRGDRPPRPSRLRTDNVTWRLLEECWSASPESRPSFLDIKRALNLNNAQLDPISSSGDSHGEQSTNHEPFLDAVQRPQTSHSITHGQTHTRARAVPSASEPSSSVESSSRQDELSLSKQLHSILKKPSRRRPARRRIPAATDERSEILSGTTNSTSNRSQPLHSDAVEPERNRSSHERVRFEPDPVQSYRSITPLSSWECSSDSEPEPTYTRRYLGYQTSSFGSNGQETITITGIPREHERIDDPPAPISRTSDLPSIRATQRNGHLRASSEFLPQRPRSVSIREGDDSQSREGRRNALA